jgi:hypothetical protein
MMPQLLRNLTNTSPELSRSRALTICSGSILSISPFVLPQLSGPWQQPASAAACRRVLEPDILEVSHLCGCMYWERVCACLCLFSERMMFSLKQNYSLNEGYTIMHVNSHALPSVSSEQSCTTFCHLYMSTLYCLMRFQIIMLQHHL